jgi:adenosylmethionine-8-amino-7-oxononanoate aminotransferase
MTEEFNPGSSVFYRDFNRPWKAFKSGDGCYLIDEDGRRYLDAAGGVAVNIVGHGETRIVEALRSFEHEVNYVYGAAFTSSWQEELATDIVGISPFDSGRVFFTSGGSEANETAVKLARQYHVERGEPRRWKVISRWLGYHGNTLSMLSVSGRPSWRSLYDPYLFNSPKIDPPYCYRCPYQKSFPSCEIACADALERAILLEGPETVAAFIAEPVLGTSVSAVVPVPGYYERIREICDQYGVLFISDEVLCGYGRTGTAFAINHWDVVPDIITIGKGLGSGYAPLAACLASDEVVDVIKKGSGRFVHGFTYSGLTLSCFIGVQVFDLIMEKQLFKQSKSMGAYLLERLTPLAERHEMIGDVRGLGLLAGIEFVADRSTRRPFDPSLEVTERVVALAEGKGLLLRQGAADANYGKGGDHVQISPPYVIGPQEINEMVEILDAVLTEVGQALA